MYRDHCSEVNQLLRQARLEYYSTKIQECDQNGIHKIAKHLMGEEETSSFPQHESAQELAGRFSDYFRDKIGAIREKLDDAHVPQSQPHMDSCNSTYKLQRFEPTTEEEIKKLIRASPCKSCDLDPLPTWLVKECATELAPKIASIVNNSLASSNVPSSLKCAHVRPLLKKTGMDADCMKNYRPVSNLPYIGKMLEKVVASRLDSHLQMNGMNSAFQSAYKHHHCTETALIRVHSDILAALDEGSSCILVLLDLSAAFDTIDHSILIQRMESTFGVKGKALGWLTSYLSNRHQTVIIHNQKSEPVLLEYGVPQGSVLGPKLYSLYTKPLADLLEENGGCHHFFADDSQLYRFFQNRNNVSQKQAIQETEHSVQIAQHWMLSNKLKCNPEKTEVLVVTPKSSPAEDVTIQIEGTEVKGKECIRNLGVMEDRHLTMERQVSHLCRSASMHLRRIGAIRRYLSIAATKTLVHSLVTSRLDYCNSLMYGLPQCLTKRLQRMQNKAARLVTRTSPREHITPVLMELHWLPVNRRIEYKVLMYAFKALNGLAPGYIEDLVVRHAPSRRLRSTDANLLNVPRTKSRYGDRTFTNSSAKLWNSIPSHMRTISNLDTFKRSLKTYLFKQEYGL